MFIFRFEIIIALILNVPFVLFWYRSWATEIRFFGLFHVKLFGGLFLLCGLFSLDGINSFVGWVILYGLFLLVDGLLLYWLFLWLFCL